MKDNAGEKDLLGQAQLLFPGPLHPRFRKRITLLHNQITGHQGRPLKHQGTLHAIHKEGHGCEGRHAQHQGQKHDHHTGIPAQSLQYRIHELASRILPPSRWQMRSQRWASA